MLAFVVLLSTFFFPSSSFGFLPEESLTLGNLFSVSCEFSTFVSRSKRSAELSDDPAEMFRYLFPLADVQPEQFMLGGARSNSLPSFASYFDDLVDLWHEECAEMKRNEAKAEAAAKRRRRRRRKRSQVRNQGALPIEPQHTGTEPITWTGFLGNLSSTWYTYMPTSEEQAPEHTGDNEDVENEDDESDDDGDDGNHDDEDSREEAADDDDDEDEEDPDDEDESRNKSKKEKKKGMTTTTTEATTTTTASGIPSIADQDPNFASYGGDIEYVLPILSCTIPFDGQITALGFHGFKGMFPY